MIDVYRVYCIYVERCTSHVCVSRRGRVRGREEVLSIEAATCQVPIPSHRNPQSQSSLHLPARMRIRLYILLYNIKPTSMCIGIPVRVCMYHILTYTYLNVPICSIQRLSNVTQRCRTPYVSEQILQLCTNDVCQLEGKRIHSPLAERYSGPFGNHQCSS